MCLGRGQTMGLVHCIVNPASRDFLCGKMWPKLLTKIIASGYQVETYMTERVGHGGHLAYEIRQQWESSQQGGESEGKPPLVVAVGGDGVVHEIASALRGSDIVLGQLPYGSGNDYCIAHNIPRSDLDKAIEILKNGTDRRCGAWRLEGVPCPKEGDYPAPESNVWDGEPTGDGNVVRWSFLEADCGITSDIGRAKLRRAKWIKGPKKYTYLGVTTIPLWKRRKVEVTIDDGKPEIRDFTLISVTAAETFGGGYKINPGMNPVKKNGLLIFAPRLSRIAMLSLMGPIKKGKHIGKWGITQTPASKLNLRCVSPNGEPSDSSTKITSYLNIDGEPVLQLPAKLEWQLDQITVRGANQVDWQ